MPKSDGFSRKKIVDDIKSNYVNALTGKKKVKILDCGVGCGYVAQSLFDAITKSKVKLYGCEVFSDYITKPDKIKGLGKVFHDLYSDITYGENGEYNKYLKDQKKNSFDIVIFSVSLHSCNNDKAKEVIYEACRVAKKAVYVSVPLGVWPKPGFSDNPYQINNLEMDIPAFESMGAENIGTVFIEDRPIGIFKFEV